MKGKFQPSNESENSGEVQDDFEIAVESSAFEEATLLQTIRNAFQAEIEDNEEANEPSTVPKPISRASCKIPSRIRQQRSDDSSEEDDRPGPSQRGGKKKSNQETKDQGLAAEDRHQKAIHRAVLNAVVRHRNGTDTIQNPSFCRKD